MDKIKENVIRYLILISKEDFSVLQSGKDALITMLSPKGITFENAKASLLEVGYFSLRLNGWILSEQTSSTH